ncbi:aspartyl protease family protein [Altererythrobacter atlanticus]|uniref:Retroviral aspartyl protease n=1 Tax=Croceibacterium atlanticum TaxID=1267766 RepID=A0A0F7KVL3_9SPHN|nr:retropepsin-like aspartic protease [Croceibacterium atlanticum]AKH42805.1 Retroviral aspartyl protease [Croceibacterium atlanticum]MBB5731585.1 aspartyl protease family protein [Croceibacterium atlanticum]
MIGTMADLSSIMTIGVTLSGGLALLSADFTPPPAQIPQPEVALASVQDNHARPIIAQAGEDGRKYLPARINGRPVRFLIDTAASQTMLSAADAATLGIVTSGNVSLRTVGGTVQAAQAKADSVMIDGVALEDVEIWIVPENGPSLLGMDVLDRLEGRYLRL